VRRVIGGRGDRSHREAIVRRNPREPIITISVVLLVLLVASCSPEEAQPYIDAAQQTAIAQGVSAAKTRAASLQKTAVVAGPGVKETVLVEAQKAKQTIEAAAKGAEAAGVAAMCTRLADQAPAQVIFESLPVTPKWTAGFGASTFALEDVVHADVGPT
jgi:hypothetical protein